MIWEIYQQRQISAAGQRSQKAERRTDSFARDVDALERQMNRLSLACQSMWELLRDHSDLTEADLENKILEVDLRDGRADGKMGGQVLTCANCGKNTNSKRSDCLMCGAPFSKPHLFES